jgi:aryl-alcohol dehydrogenase-like predicted oxidoreductase
MMANVIEFRGMPCRRLGNSGLWVSEIGLGLWKWGYPEYDGARVGEHLGFQILDRALDVGVFHWDTANSYNAGSGNSERLLGKYFSRRPNAMRDQVVLATKISNHHRQEHKMGSYPKNLDDFTPNQSGASRIYLMREVEHCLDKLQTDRIDLLYLHSAHTWSGVGSGKTDWITPLEETWSTMDDLVTQGKVRYIAVSNHSAEQTRAVMEVLRQVGKDASRNIVAVENCYSLAERSAVASDEAGDEQAFLEFCKETGLSIVPYFPLGGGLLTGRYTARNLEEVEGRLTTEGIGERFLTEQSIKLSGKVARIAKEKGCSSAQLAIAWLLAHEQIGSVIAGVTKLEHLEDNAQAFSVELTADDLDELDKISR